MLLMKIFATPMPHLIYETVFRYCSCQGFQEKACRPNKRSNKSHQDGSNDTNLLLCYSDFYLVTHLISFIGVRRSAYYICTSLFKPTKANFYHSWTQEIDFKPKQYIIWIFFFSAKIKQSYMSIEHVSFFVNITLKWINIKMIISPHLWPVYCNTCDFKLDGKGHSS